MHSRHKYRGFTIVELLIVIVVIGILAAITIVAYNGVQDKAKTASILSDLTNNRTKVMIGRVNTGIIPTTVDVLTSGDTQLSVGAGLYNIFTYCSTDTDFVIAAESKSGNKFYTRNNAAAIQDNSIDAYNPCAYLGIQNTNGSQADKTYLGMSNTSCATELTNCSFVGTATIAYGYKPLGKFTAIPNLTSPVACNNTFFGDPASGYSKACYIISN